ncbi:MAG: beta-galactosidase, partial [Phycisphaerae bacterium]|nr:beta-galactosidase [Phycisphaerae bacterium]
MADRLELLWAALRNKRTALILLMLMLGAGLSGSLVAADRPQAGLAQRCVLPAYDPWIPDPEYAELRPDVVTPHTPWARPYAGRSLKLVVIAPRWTQRATLELQQRFDFDASAVMARFAATWADPNTPHYGWIKYGTEELTTARAMAALRAARRPDVIVIGWMSCPAIPKKVEQALLDAVAGGAGLVIFNPRKLSPKLEALIKKCKPAPRDAVNAVVDGIPTGHLPPLKQQGPRGLVGQGVKFYLSDAGGRIVVVDYSPLPPGAYPWCVNCYISPPGADTSKSVRDIHYDYYCSLAGRCILWAAKNMPPVRLTGWEKLPSRINTKDAPGNLGALLVAPAARCPAGAVVQLVIRDLDATVEHRSSTKVRPDGRINLAVGQLTSGGHYADVILRDAAGRTLDWGSRYFESISGAEITAVSAENKSYKLDRPVPVTIALTGDLDGAKLAVEVLDAHGRVVWSATVAPKPKISLQADVADALTSQCEIRATLSKAGRLLAKHTVRILLRQPPPDADRYIYGAWASANPSFVRRQTAKIMAAQGVTTGILGGDMDEWAALNVRPAPYMTRHYPNNPGQKGLMVREPCLTDPAFLKKETAKLKDNAEKFRHYSPPVYSLGDDVGMMLTNQDACISATCLKAFRKYLARQYGSVKALNASWGTSYTSFDQAMPLSLADAVAGEKFPAWADHRMYMDELFVKIHRDAKSIIRGVDPDARVGFEGPLSDNSWYGYAWKELLEVMDLMVPYPNAWKFDIVRSFARPGLTSGGWYGGYPMYRNPDDWRFYPWFLLFSGCNSYWFFAQYGWSTYGDQSQGIAPDLRVLPCLDQATTQVRRIQQGIDRLVLGARRQTDGVAVYHSRLSVHAATVMPPIPLRDFNTDPTWSAYIAGPDMKWARNIEANLRLLDDVGLSYVFVDRIDIADGALIKGKFRLLVMPLV